MVITNYFRLISSRRQDRRDLTLKDKLNCLLQDDNCETGTLDINEKD